MAIKKWITKKEIADILKTYSVRTDEFEQIGTEGYFFQSRFTKGYTISFEPEIQHGTEKTGRIVISHSKNGGKRTFHDIWERDSNNKLQFMYRNPWNRPFSDYDYICSLEAQIIELKEAGQKLQSQLAALAKKNQELINGTKHNARGAGRKADPEHLEAQAREVQNLLADGKTADEVQKIMGISKSSFFRYKKLR